MTAQEIFDKVAAHLLTQRKPSLLCGIGCAYRGEGGLKCAAGCLIPDEEYSPEMEGRNWHTLASRDSVYRGVAEKIGHVPLVVALQLVHDGVDNWERGNISHGLSFIAKNYQLDAGVVDQYPVL